MALDTLSIVAALKSVNTEAISTDTELGYCKLNISIVPSATKCRTLGYLLAKKCLIFPKSVVWL